MTDETRKRNRFRPKKRLELPHTLYDLSIEDMEERKTKALPFSDGYDVAEFLGRNSRYVSSKTGVGKIAKNIDCSKQYAIRVPSK